MCIVSYLLYCNIKTKYVSYAYMSQYFFYLTLIKDNQMTKYMPNI